MPVLYAALLGLFVQVGFLLLSCGLVRKKNAAHMVMLTFSAYVFVLLAYYAVGHALQSGFHGFFLVGVPLDARVMFDIVLALVAGYVLVGAICERIAFRMFLVCELFVGGLLYPVLAHSVWSGGWLSRIGALLGLERGFVDYAGSSVVHSLGGFCAMALAMILGPRLGKYGRDGQPRPFLAHNIVYVAAGTLLLLFGWTGVVAGSRSAIEHLAAAMAINTNLAAVGGATSAMLFWTLSYGKPDISMACNGLLAGLVAISASAPLVGPNASVVIGAVAGLIACAGVLLNERTFKIDDPCGSIAVHGYGGWWGAVAVGVFADGTAGVTGLLHGDLRQLITQCVGATLCAAYAFALTYVVFTVVNTTWRLRVDPEIEAEGLDLTEFGMLAYPEDESV